MLSLARIQWLASQPTYTKSAKHSSRGSELLTSAKIYERELDRIAQRSSSARGLRLCFQMFVLALDGDLFEKCVSLCCWVIRDVVVVVPVSTSQLVVFTHHFFLSRKLQRWSQSFKTYQSKTEQLVVSNVSLICGCCSKLIVLKCISMIECLCEI